MSSLKHLSDETLLRYAAGSLGAGLRLVADVHLDGCAACRARVREFFALGGAMLESQLPAPVPLARVEDIFTRVPVEPPAPPAVRLDVDGFVLPEALAHCGVGRWRFVHPKLRWARVTLPQAPLERVILLKIAAGFSAPEHDHRGLELTQILYGAFSDGRALYQPGDVVEADVDIERHEPRVTAEGDCLCLAAVERPIRIHSRIGRLFQPLMGI